MTRSHAGLLLWVLSFLMLPLSFLALPPAARAGNDDEILLGNDAALMGGAVVAGVNDGSALWYNPAGLGRASGDKVDVGASAFTLRSYRYPNLVRIEGGTEGNANFTEFLTVPSALTYVRRFGSRVTGGLGLFASHYNDATLRASSRIESAAGEELQLAVLYAGEVARYHLIGGVGIVLSERLTLGVALSGDYQSDVDISRTTFTGKPVAGRSEAAFASTESSVSGGTTLGFHLRAGVTFDATERLRLGVSVESPGFYFYRTTHSSNESIAAVLGSSPSLDAVAETPTVRTTSLGLYAPVRVRFGGAYAVAGGTVALEADVQSKVKDRAVEVDRVFTWNVRAGARFPLNEHYRVGAGFFTDRGPERKEPNGTGRLDYYGGTVGLQYENVRMLAPKPGETDARHGLTFSSTAALRYAYGAGKQTGVLFDPDCPGAMNGICNTAVNVSVHELTLHLGSGLYF